VFLLINQAETFFRSLQAAMIFNKPGLTRLFSCFFSNKQVIGKMKRAFFVGYLMKIKSLSKREALYHYYVQTFNFFKVT
jgi:hypothetical protein